MRARGGEMRKQPGVLNHIANAVAQANDVDIANRLPVDHTSPLESTSRRFTSFSVVFPDPLRPINEVLRAGWIQNHGGLVRLKAYSLCPLNLAEVSMPPSRDFH